MKRIAIVVGTRPEIIKMSPVVRACGGSGVEWFMVRTGQDCSCDADSGVLGGHGGPTGKMFAGIEKILIVEKPDVVLVEGDTNTVLAGALAASKLGVRVGHVEAGLRGHR